MLFYTDYTEEENYDKSIFRIYNFTRDFPPNLTSGTNAFVKTGKAATFLFLLWLNTYMYRYFLWNVVMYMNLFLCLSDNYLVLSSQFFSHYILILVFSSCPTISGYYVSITRKREVDEGKLIRDKSLLSNYTIKVLFEYLEEVSND